MQAVFCGEVGLLIARLVVLLVLAEPMFRQRVVYIQLNQLDYRIQHIFVRKGLGVDKHLLTSRYDLMKELFEKCQCQRQ